ncbi:hypothetical protein D3C84_1214740 [compost metagenome]
MTNANSIGLCAQGCIKGIGAHNPNRGKGGGNAAASIMGGGEKKVFFNKVIFAYPDIVW